MLESLILALKVDNHTKIIIKYIDSKSHIVAKGSGQKRKPKVRARKSQRVRLFRLRFWDGVRRSTAVAGLQLWVRGPLGPGRVSWARAGDGGGGGIRSRNGEPHRPPKRGMAIDSKQLQGIQRGAGVKLATPIEDWKKNSIFESKSH